MKIKYPLEQVLAVKRDRVEKAERIVEEKKRAAAVEQEKLKKVEEERDQVLNHHRDKLAQLRKALDEGTYSDEVIQMKVYLKVVKERLVKEEEKVRLQKEQVRIAEKNLEDARRELKKRRLEEEKISLHKEQWVKEMKAEHGKQEAKEQDEIGQVLYETKRQKKDR